MIDCHNINLKLWLLLSPSPQLHDIQCMFIHEEHSTDNEHCKILQCHIPPNVLSHPRGRENRAVSVQINTHHNSLTTDIHCTLFVHEILDSTEGEPWDKETLQENVYVQCVKLSISSNHQGICHDCTGVSCDYPCALCTCTHARTSPN